MRRQRSRPNLPLGLVGLALVAGLAGLAWWTLNATPAPSLAGERELVERGDGVAGFDAASAEERGGAAPSAEAAVRGEVADEPPIAAPVSGPPRRTSGLRMRVLRRDTLAPVANFPVRAYDTWELAGIESERAPYVDADPLARFERLGSVERSDAQGELYLPRPRGRLQVLASAQGLYGEAQLRPSSEEPALLYVRPARSLDVFVVDAQGEPVLGAPIAVRARLASERRVLYEGRTVQQADGRVYARVLALDPLFERAEGQEAFVGLAFPTQAPVEQRLDPDALPTRVELTLPPTGAIRVRLLDEVGKPVHAACVAHLTLDAKGLAQGPAQQRADTLRYGRAFEDGEFVVPLLPLGERYSLRVQCDGFPRQNLPAIDGPRVSGEEVLLEYRFQKRMQVLVGRVVDAAGVPQAERAFQALVTWPQLPRNEGWRLESMLVTDREGRYRYCARNGLGNGVRELHLIDVGPRKHANGSAGAAAIEASADPSEPAAAPGDAAGDAADEAAASAGEAAAAPPAIGVPLATTRRSGRVALPEPAPPGDVELADIVLADEQARARGSVVDEAGNPIRGAHVWLEQPRAARGNDDDQDAPRIQYERVGDGAVYSDEQGAFVLFRIDGLAGPLYIRADKEGYLQQQRVPFDPNGARVVLSNGGALGGRVLLSRDVARERLAASLRAQFVVSGDNEPREVELSIESDGRFRARGLESGAWDFALKLEGSERPLFEARGALVEAGQTCTDERLQAIDLRELVHGYTLTVLAPDGEPVGDGRVAVLALERGENATSTRVELRGGRARVATAGASIDVEVSARGYRPLQLLGLREDRTVRLEAGLLVRLRLARPEPSAANRRYQAALEPDFGARAEDEIPAWAEDGEWISFDERGEAVCTLPAVGAYTVRVWSWSEDERGSAWGGRNWVSLGPEGPDTPWNLAIAELAGEQVFDLRPGEPPRAPAEAADAPAEAQR
jgi:hypothetical protein